MADTKSLLLDLPPELTNSIAAHLPSKDLLTLRLVSKHVAACTQAAMLQANFAHLHILFCVPDSLKKALDVAKSPNLKKGVRKLSIYHNRFRAQAGPAGLKLADLRPNTPVEIRREIRCTQWAIYNNFVEKQMELEQSRNDQKFVTDILRELKSNHHGLEVSIAELDVQVDPQGKHYCRFGRSNMKEFDKLAEMFDGDLVVDGHPYHRPLYSVLEAVKLADVRLAGLEAGGQTQQVPMHAFTDLNGFLSVQQHLSALTSLKLCFQHSPKPAHKHAEDRGITNFISLLQLCAPTLESLWLSMDEEPFGNEGATWNKIFARMVKEVKLPAVERLSISKVNVDYQQFLHFLADHASHLKLHFLFNIRVSGYGPRLSRTKWKTKVRADLEGVGFPVAKGMVLLHQDLYEPDEYSDDESEDDGDVDEDEVLFRRAYPSMRSLIMD